MTIFGIVLLVIGLILFSVQHSQKQKIFSLKSAQPMTVAELQKTAAAVAEEIGGGNWRDYVKLWGEVVADEPLQSEHCDEPCVHYISTVIREYEETEQIDAKDSGIKKIRKRKSETVSKTQRSVPFWLRDRTGQIKINPDGAKIELVQILDELRPAQVKNTLGYRYRESILPVTRSVLIVGEISDSTGDLVIRKPVKSSNQFLISLKDEETLASVTAKNIKLSFWVMLACWGAGSVLLIAGILG